MYKVETEFGTYDVSIETSTYYYGGNLSISLITEKSFVDTNNCPWAEKFISDNKLGRPTGIKAASGYCVYPQYRFDMEKLK